MLEWLKRLLKKDKLSTKGAVEKRELEEYRKRKRFEKTLKGKLDVTRQDISKFMKHGRQSKWYRASIKAKKKPEED